MEEQPTIALPANTNKSTQFPDILGYTSRGGVR